MAKAIAAFAGPSVYGLDRKKWPEVDWFAPAGRGDLWSKLNKHHRCVALIDGYYDQRPAVYHKEILDVMSGGVRVVGGASIGALRAAELENYGMVGVGRVFESIKAGQIEGDDEVAVLHAPSELGFQPLTFPLVELRFTLASLEERIPLDTLEGIWRAAQSLPFLYRTLPNLKKCSPNDLRTQNAIQMLSKSWCRQKREDAICVLTSASTNTEPCDMRGTIPPTSWQTLHKLEACPAPPDSPDWIGSMAQLLAATRLLWEKYPIVHDTLLLDRLKSNGGYLWALVNEFEDLTERRNFLRTLRTQIGTLPDAEILDAVLAKRCFYDWLKDLRLQRTEGVLSFRDKELFFDSPGSYSHAVEWLRSCGNTERI